MTSSAEIRIGEYLGRQVRVMSDDISTLRERRFDNATVLIVTGSDSVKAVHVNDLLPAILAKNPLVIMTCGKLARSTFDKVLDILADGRNRPQIMTRIAENMKLEQAVEEFLKETWPAEERFDDWDEYAIIDLNHDAKSIINSVGSNL